ncbi:MAG: [FeFe] hydrogenase H-cluster radical SAM maturase HydG [Patescibacteria group bacterium]
MPNIKDVIDEQKIYRILGLTKSPNKKIVEKILKKARNKKGLNLEEVGFLLNVDGKQLIEEIFKTAEKIKNDIYGERLVLFAPLYVSSFCVNDCEYCGFHRRNKSPRKKLTLKEVREQVKILENMGHKRLLLEFGEDPKENPIDYVTDVIKEIYKIKFKNGEIRRVNINIAATTVEDYRKLKEVGIGTYQLFQETYHKKSYEKLHNGPKQNYERQLFAHNRAFEAGIDDVGLGVLFGLYDYKFEVLALISHAKYLDKKFGVGPHTFSVPRFQPADSVKFNSPYKVSEDELLKIIAILRLAVPYTGMIISTREKPETRAKAFKIGISQTSAGSKTAPGGYGHKKILEQFNVADERNVPEIIESILQQDLLPSFCTACYRQGRTGEKFMAIAKPGDIHNLCRPNAVLTFKEYLEDYANAKIKKLGQKIIEKYLDMIEKEDTKIETMDRLKRIENGERDLYF